MYRFVFEFILTFSSFVHDNVINTKNINWICHHLHIDKSKTITPKLLDESLKHMKAKWFIMRDIKKNYTEEELENRMLDTTKSLVEQGCKKMRTFIDVDNIVGLDCLHVANKVKKYWKNIFTDVCQNPTCWLKSPCFKLRDLDRFKTKN